MSKRLLTVLIFLLSCTSGCIRVGPPYKTPPAQEYDEWTQNNDLHISDSEDDAASWSSVFEDPRLQRLIDMAIAQNYSLKTAAWRILEARAQLQIATGRFFPQTQQAFGSWESIRVSKNAPNARFADKIFRNALFGLIVSWELDFWGKYRSAIDSAEYIYQASETDYFGVQLILTSDIAKAYINLCTFIDISRVIQENIKLQRRSIQIITVRLEAGLVSELDLQQAQVLLSNTEAQLPIAEREIVNQKNALAVLLGTTPDEISCILDTEDLSIPFIPSTAVVGVPADLLCRRPDLIASRQLILSQTGIVGISEADLLPQISLFGVIGYDATYGNHLRSTNVNKNFFSMNSLTYSYGPEFSWPILNYGRLTGRVDLEWARLQGMIQQYQNLVLKAYEEAENAMIAFIKAHEERTYLETGLQAALRAYALSQELYLEGLVDYERVLEAQRSLLAIQDLYTVNKGNIALFFVQIYQALGGTIYTDGK
jgi:NodT family efflux transporter outer membrane factor (OMF) lipoprotein